MSLSESSRHTLVEANASDMVHWGHHFEVEGVVGSEATLLSVVSSRAVMNRSLNQECSWYQPSPLRWRGFNNDSWLKTVWRREGGTPY